MKSKRELDFYSLLCTTVGVYCISYNHMHVVKKESLSIIHQDFYPKSSVVTQKYSVCLKDTFRYDKY